MRHYLAIAGVLVFTGACLADDPRAGSLALRVRTRVQPFKVQRQEAVLRYP